MNITIRPTTPGDAEPITRLELEFVDYLKRLGDTSPTSLNKETFLRDGFGPAPAFSGFTAEKENRVIGYILYHPGYDIDRGGRIFYVLDLYVTESCRGQGAGLALMNRVGEACLAAGGGELVWSVFRPNVSAISFYEHIGGRRLSIANMDYMHLKLR